MRMFRQMDITWVGEDITDGLIGSITVALNMCVLPLFSSDCL